MSTPDLHSPARGPAVDAEQCAREPIHVPGSIQPHGVLMVLGAGSGAGGLVVRRISANAGEMLGVDAGLALGRGLAGVVGAAMGERLGAALAKIGDAGRAVSLGEMLAGVGASARWFFGVAHRLAGGDAAGIVLELELSDGPGAAPGPEPALDAFTLAAESAGSLEELSRAACVEVRRLTGFDRVLVYRFDEEWNGTVIGEDGNGRLPRLVGHRFPASDIPAQARELYRLNRVRIIPDAGYAPVGLVPGDVEGGRLDLSLSTLRSVSPVHVEYMKNMETLASMSVSILREGRLWGLISCHHREPRRVTLPLRGACDLIGRAFSLRLSAIEHIEDYQRKIEVRSAYAELVAVMAERADFSAALSERAGDLLSLGDAGGAAVVTPGSCVLVGDTPSEAQVRGLAAWLFEEVKEEVYSTDALPAAYVGAGAAEFREKASGLMAVAISKLHPSYVMWFRPEVVRTVTWGGEPGKRVEVGADGTATLHPRRSFEAWRETVRDRSPAWRPSETEAAAGLRNVIVGTVLKRAEELAALNAELTRSNKELEAFSYSVSHDLRAPLRHIVGYAEMLRDSAGGTLSERDERCVKTIIESSEYAGKLVDKLLNYSRLGRSQLEKTAVDMNVLVEEARKVAERDAVGRVIEWRVGKLPIVEGDAMMVRMAVRDLLSNAVKYTRGREPAVIEVGHRAGVGDAGAEDEFFVRDNGVGFDMQYADKLFGVFQRLHRWEDFEGTGIGLANVRRVVERHGGRAWAHGEEGKGATFFFTLPKKER